MDNNTFVLNYYADTKYEPLSDLLKQVSIKTENQLMELSNSSGQDCPDTGRITGAYNIFYQGGKFYHGTLDCETGPGICVPW